MKNIIWLIPDGIRQIEYDDPYGRLEAFNQVKQDGFSEFKNIYTAAPSTYMSFVSFLRGVYPTKMAYKYGELKATKSEIPTIDKKFKELNYNIYFFTFYPDDLREQVDNDIFKLVKDKEALIKGLYSDNPTDYNDYIKYFLETEQLKEPFFLMLHFTTPAFETKEEFFSYDINGYFKFIYNKLYKYFDDSIVFIHADHGYPIYKDKKYKQTHHELVTQENIKPVFFTNLFDKDIYTNHSLVDIYPTLCDIFNFEKHNRIDGVSFFENKEDRIIKIENLFPSQKNRKSVLIINDKKLVYDYDTYILKLYDTKDNELNLSDYYKELFFEFEEQFEKERKNTIEENMLKKQNKIYNLLKDKSKLFIKLIDNEFINKFLDNQENYEITNLEKLPYKINNNYDLIILLIDNIHNIITFSNIDNIKMIEQKIHVIDAYLNLEESIDDKDNYLKLKKEIYKHIQARKNRVKKKWFQES